MPATLEGVIVASKPFGPVADRLTVPVKEKNGWTVMIDVCGFPTVAASEGGEADNEKSGG